MKILSSLPSVLAKVSDLVERDVTSDIEVFQAAEFPLLRMPSVLRNLGGNNLDRLVESKIVFHELSVTNGAAQAQDLLRLGRGVWDIHYNVQYISNFTVFPPVAGGQFMFIDPVTGTQNLIWGVNPMTGHSEFGTVWRITTDRDDLEFELRLGAAGVGQSHYVQLSAYFAKMA